MGSFRPDPNLLKKHPNAITQTQIDEKGRFIGALLAAAAGESLGAPHENKTAADVGTPRETTVTMPSSTDVAFARALKASSSVCRTKPRSSPSTCRSAGLRIAPRSMAASASSE